MIRNIIFDLAGVLLNLDIEKDTFALNSIGLPDFEGCLQREEIYVPTLAYLNGLMPAGEYCDAIRPVCKEGVSNEKILWAMDEVLADFPKSRMQMLVELRKKYKVFLLSNLYKTAWDYTLDQFEQNGFTPEQCFDKVFLSYEMQLAKPDTRIYKEVCRESGILPEETLYFDDSKSNVDAGNALGMKSFLVKMNCLEEIIFDEKGNLNSLLFTSDMF